MREWGVFQVKCYWPELYHWGVLKTVRFPYFPCLNLQLAAATLKTIKTLYTTKDKQTQCGAQGGPGRGKDVHVGVFSRKSKLQAMELLWARELMTDALRCVSQWEWSCWFFKTSISVDLDQQTNRVQWFSVYLFSGDHICLYTHSDRGWADLTTPPLWCL